MEGQDSETLPNNVLLLEDDVELRTEVRLHL